MAKEWSYPLGEDEGRDNRENGRGEGDYRREREYMGQGERGQGEDWMIRGRFRFRRRVES